LPTVVVGTTAGCGEIVNTGSLPSGIGAARLEAGSASTARAIARRKRTVVPASRGWALILFMRAHR
jgi:hypothetical protein